jgi:hypothetical protein
VFQARTAKVDITPEGEIHLIETYARKPRMGLRHRDMLMARALALSDDENKIVVVSADLLCVSEELHRAVAQKLPELGERGVFLTGTHTHSSFGGFFHSAATRAMLGEPKKPIFDFLVDRLVRLARSALDDMSPARAGYGSSMVPGLVSSRREEGGPHDDRIDLLRLQRPDRRPIDLVSASGHPVVVAEHEANTVSGDYPGEFCRKLEATGCDPLFVNAGLGGVSILFPEFKMDLDRHLALATGLLMSGYHAAIENLQSIALEPGSSLKVDFFRVPHGPHRSQVFSALGLGGRLADKALYPVRKWLSGVMSEALPFAEGVPLHLLGLGSLCLIGSANELGVSVVQALREVGRLHGHEQTMACSLVNGYAGYIHLAPVYRRWPEKGYRFLALYENALAMFGTSLGDRLVESVGERLEGWN